MDAVFTLPGGDVVEVRYGREERGTVGRDY